MSFDVSDHKATEVLTVELAIGPRPDHADLSKVRRDSRRYAARRTATWSVAFVVLAANVLSLRALLSGLDRGLFRADEAFYLLAALPENRAASFNGGFGWYLGGFLDLIGWNIPLARGLSVLLLVFCACILGREVVAQCLRRLEQDWSRIEQIAVAGTVLNSSLLYYFNFIRTPSYNSFACSGILIVATALLRLCRTASAGRQSPGTIAALSVGIALTAAGKLTSAGVASGVAVVLILLLRPRTWRVRLRQVALLAALLGAMLTAHFSLVLGPQETFDALSRAGQHISTIEPERYSLGPALMYIPRGIAATLVAALSYSYATPLLPPLAALARRSPLTVVRLGMLPVGLGAVRFCLEYPGGSDGALRAALPLIVCLISVAATEFSLWRSGGFSSPALHSSAIALSFLVPAYALGSDQPFVIQTLGAGGVLAAAAVIFTSGRNCLATLRITLCLCLCISSAVMIVRTAKLGPINSGRTVEQVFPTVVVPGRVTLKLDRDAHDWFAHVTQVAALNGWRPGMPMVDLSLSAAVPLALGAHVPNTLLPGSPMVRQTSGQAAALAMSIDSSADWRSAWIVVPLGLGGVDFRPMAEITGRHFPEDYQLVVDLPNPTNAWFWGQQIWKPRIR